MEITGSCKGIFVTISVLFLTMALLIVIGLSSQVESAKKINYAQSTDIFEINSIKSNIEHMSREAFSVSGFQFSVYNQTLSIEENSTKRGLLSNDLLAIEEFWNGLVDKNVSLDFYENASIPVLNIKPVNFTLIQNTTRTSINVPDNSSSSLLAYFITIKTNCSTLDSSWNNISETNTSNALNFTIGVECMDSNETESDFRQLNRSEYSEIQITETGSNLTVVKITDPGSIEIIKYRSSYLNIIMPMNESVYFEVPSSLNISRGDAAYVGAINLPR
jgi:hypothetical protein